MPTKDHPNSGGAEMRLFSGDIHIVSPRVVPVSGDTSQLHWIARLGARWVRYGSPGLPPQEPDRTNRI